MEAFSFIVAYRELISAIIKEITFSSQPSLFSENSASYSSSSTYSSSSLLLIPFSSTQLPYLTLQHLSFYFFVTRHTKEMARCREMKSAP